MPEHTFFKKPWSAAWAGWIAAGILLMQSGCSDGRPERVPVSGRVLIDGEPLKYGSIRFYPQNHRAASGEIKPDGSFTLTTYEFGDGCVPGVHPVSVNASEWLNSRMQRWHAPKKYYGPATSGLTFEVTGATEDAEIHLSWDGGKPFDEPIEGAGE